MLSSLHIKNIALIASADIVFDRHLNVLSGETGAGKSIVIDSINALSGQRASREIIRAGSSESEVSGVFVECPSSVLNFLRDAGHQCGDEIMLSRVIQSDGRNICRIDGKPVSLSFLRSLCQMMISIHGQQDNSGLLQKERHIEFLDRLAGLDTRIYQEAFEGYKRLEKERKTLRSAHAEKQRLLEQLAWKIEELKALNVRQGEPEALASRRKLLRSSGKIRNALDEAYHSLYGCDDTPDGCCDLAARASGALSSVAGESEILGELCGRLGDLHSVLEDVLEEVRNLRGDMEDSEHELEEIETRLDTLHKTGRKYGIQPENIPHTLDLLRDELEALTCSGERLSELDALCQKSEALMLSEGKKLTAIRKKSADELKCRIVQELHELDMQNVRFETTISPAPPRVNGCDEAEFLISANPGEEPKPLSKVASGGEMARIMLALKNILSQGDDTHTLIFDEVDSGVSGRAAQRVAEKLCSVSRSRQVLCVTHLPQIAAMADRHFLIHKSQEGGRTITRLEPLSREGRIDEISRLVGGAVITDATRASAGEILLQAENFRFTKS
ncbi:MAG: DNA repair protein RecN [Oscillospiraceae bacterium]|nr:DNA repair protein RecN [Oscillospiraceae bacterium]